MNVEHQPILIKPVPPDLVDYYFTRVKFTQGYVLNEVVYNTKNRPVSTDFGKSVWNAVDARRFAKLCGGWILSAGDKVQEAKTAIISTK